MKRITPTFDIRCDRMICLMLCVPSEPYVVTFIVSLHADSARVPLSMSHFSWNRIRIETCNIAAVTRRTDDTSVEFNWIFASESIFIISLSFFISSLRAFRRMRFPNVSAICSVHVRDVRRRCYDIYAPFRLCLLPMCYTVHFSLCIFAVRCNLLCWPFVLNRRRLLRPNWLNPIVKHCDWGCFPSSSDPHCAERPTDNSLKHWKRLYATLWGCIVSLLRCFRVRYTRVSVLCVCVCV